MAEYAKSTQTRRLEYLRGSEEQEAPAPARTFAVDDNDLTEYVAVAPEYQTYANEYDRPIKPEGVYGEVFDFAAENDPNAVIEADEDGLEKEEEEDGDLKEEDTKDESKPALKKVTPSTAKK